MKDARKPFRSRIIHQLCRECHRRIKQKARPIKSREINRGSYRRTRSRKNFTTKSVPKVIANRNNRKNQNA